MATNMTTQPSGMTGAVRSLQWTIQDLSSSVEHLGQLNDNSRRSQNIMAWTIALFGALLLSGLVWIANDIFHLKDQMSETDRRFDGIETQVTALGSRLDDLGLTIEQVGAELLASRSPVAAAPAGPEVSVLSTPAQSADLQTAAAPLAPAAQGLDAAAQPPQQVVAVAPQEPAVAAAAAIAPSPPAPRDQLTAEELAQPSPVVVAAAPAAAPAPAAAAPAPAAAASTVVAAAPAAAAPAAAPEPAAAPAPAAAAPAGDLSDDQLLSYNDDQLDPTDELLLLDENGNPQ